MRAAAADTDDQVSSDTHVAVVDDDADVATLLVGYLRSHGFRVTSLRDGASLLALMPVDPPALVLLDLGLPGEDGLSIAGKLRAQWRCGLVIVTGRGDAVDKVVGLELGADDYVTKPFDLRELLARVKAVLRRIDEAASPLAEPAPARGRFRFAGFSFDAAARVLRHSAGHDVTLTAGEFDLLHTFLQHPGRVLSRDFILEHTRGREASPFDRTIDVLVGRLRRKLESEPESPQLIKSVRGAGYILVPAVEAG